MRPIDEVIAALCRMPLDYHGPARPIDLLERSGYLDHRGKITADQLGPYLDLELMDAWQGWADDKRYTPVWYFTTLGPDVFEVGYIVRAGKKTRQMTYADRRRACAEFILLDIEQLADGIEFWARPWRAIRRRFYARGTHETRRSGRGNGDTNPRL